MTILSETNLKNIKNDYEYYLSIGHTEKQASRSAFNDACHEYHFEDEETGLQARHEWHQYLAQV